MVTISSREATIPDAPEPAEPARSLPITAVT
jgi:hypothetical protein